MPFSWRGYLRCRFCCSLALQTVSRYHRGAYSPESRCSGRATWRCRSQNCAVISILMTSLRQTLLMLAASVVDSSHVAVMSSGSLLCAAYATASLSRDSASLNITRCLTLTLTSTLTLTLTRRFNLQPTVDRIVRPMSAPSANPSASLAPPHSPHPPRSAGCRRGIKLSTSSHSSPGAARRGDPASLLTTYPPTRASAQSSASVRRCSSTCKPQEGRLPI